jgi:SAM-dependent methyltransferase
MGDEYPAELDPHSYVSRSELRRFALEVHVGRDETLVDIGCGRGGPGLSVAAETGSLLIGIDIAEAPLVDARQRAAALGVPATFQRGTFEATGLQTSTVHAVMSLDALLFTPDKAAALREARRILRPRGRLVLTSWDYDRQPDGRPRQVGDHRPLAEASGFRVIAYEETEAWRERLRGTGEGLLEAVEELAAESGEDVEQLRAELVEENATIEAMTRRVLLVAEAQ